MTAWQHAPAPKHSPRRDPSWRSEGAEIAAYSRLLGREPLPWQRHVWDIATEYRVIGPGESPGDVDLGRRRYRYDTVLITVPRQSGKTAGMAPVRAHRMIRLYHERLRVNARRAALGSPLLTGTIKLFSTAQTGKDAGSRMRDMIELVMSSPLGDVFKPHFSTGAEGLSYMPDDGRLLAAAQLTRFAPVVGAIHGETPYLVDLDEIWKLDDDLGRDLFEGAIEPAMSTLHGYAQTWMLSTMGTEQSHFMNRLIKAGRDGRRPGLAYFEWSMPDGLDPYDEASWWTFHPALGNTITPEALRARMPGATPIDDDAEAPVGSHAEWMRAYMNRLTAADDPLLSEEALAELVTEPAGGPPPTTDLAIAVDVAPESACASVVAAWHDDDGLPCLRTVHTAPGASWVPDFIEQLRREWQPKLIAGDDGGPTRRVLDILETEHDVPVVRTDFRAFTTACDSLLTLARDRQIRLDGSETLRGGFLRVEQRTTNGLSRFDRDRSPGPITGPIAAVAVYALEHADAPRELQIF